MSALMEALQRRAVPAGGQMSQPTAATPGGGPNVPVSMPPQMTGQDLSQSPNVGQTASPGASSGSGGNAMLSGLQQTQGPQFDEETRKMSKALVSKLLSIL